jgi:hypothetical protein
VLTLTQGQLLTGVVFTAPKGASLKIRAADPDRVLTRQRLRILQR